MKGLGEEMRFLSLLALILLVSSLLNGCGGVEVKDRNIQPSPSKDQQSRKLFSHTNSREALAQKRVKLFIGQDLNSIRGYVKTGKYPKPAGVTTYLSFYNLMSENFPAYGGLGIDRRGYPTSGSVDWGAGPLNALALAKEYPGSALNIGLNIAEGNQSTIWVEGGLKAISEGKHNNEINHLARFFKSIDNPVFLRIGYEFDGVWNKGYENTQNYIEAYKHIVDTLRAKRVRNVAFVWQASASPIDDIIESKRENIQDWYPGDDYVDWVGFSWFLPPDKAVKGSATQRGLANEVLQFARQKRKPVMIAEASPQGYDLGKLSKSNISPLWDGTSGKQSKQVSASKLWVEWFTPFFTFIRSNADIIKAVAYINADWDSQALWSAPYANGYWGDSRVQINQDISKRWLSEINDRSFWTHSQ